MATVKEALIRIEAHEKECLVRYTNIEKRLDDGKAKMDRLELMLWGIYPFILGAIVISKIV
jgi:hypothetical protein|tara:strand:+ start:467 stop:649 length:183 start_codon:yes stop_codon:yes gene_type:complete